jgi:hypothetical protein
MGLGGSVLVGIAGWLGLDWVLRGAAAVHPIQ